MKRIQIATLIVVLGLIAGIAWSYSRTSLEAPGGDEVWRYDIVQIKQYGGDGEETFPILLRLDTATGKTWRYIPPIKHERDIVEGWIQIPEITDDRLLDEDKRFLP
jgi:hypothetical protein